MEDRPNTPDQQPQHPRASYTVGRGGTELNVSGDRMDVTPPNSSGWVSSDSDREGDILSTARNAQGSPVRGRGLRESDVVSVQGMQVSVAVAANLGLLTRTPWGEYVATTEGNANAVTPQAPGEAPEAGPEAGADVLRMDDAAEAVMDTLVAQTSPSTQIAAIGEFLSNGGEISEGTLNRLASEAQVSPDEMAQNIETVQAGFYSAVEQRLTARGIPDMDAFGEWLDSDRSLVAERGQAIRELLTQNSVAGFEALADRYLSALDTIDPEAVKEACEAEGIEVLPAMNGGLILNIPHKGQFSWREAVSAGVFKVRRA